MSLEWIHEKEAVNALVAAIKSGINLIDSSSMDGGGLSEEIIRKTIKNKR